jgi:5-methylcytosine-specific restriction endonuclease McrA
MSKNKGIHKKKRVPIPEPIIYAGGEIIGRFCTDCRIPKDTQSFSKSAKRLGGLYPVCKECVSIENKQKYVRTKKVHNKKAREYYLKNKEKVKAKSKAYAKANRPKLNSYFYARDRDKRQKALTKPFFKEMRNLYIEAKEKGMTLDHIIPLNNPNVSGLHVPWNTQFLPFEVNASKNNKFDGTYENESWKEDL